jgi:3-oxoacyl-[acyl-carrier-protein] synthase II
VLAEPTVRPRRVVITGLGAVTTLGADLLSSAAAFRQGASAPLAMLPSPQLGESTAIVRVPDADPRPHFRVPKALKLCDRRTRLAVSAAAMAMSASGLDAAREPAAIGVVLGTSSSDPRPEELARPFADAQGEAAVDDPRQFAERILARLHPLWLLVELPNMASAHVAIQLGLEGPNSTVMTDWAAGAQALGEGFRWVQAGEAVAVLAGGADVGADALTVLSYRQCGLFADGEPTASAPALGEGAAVLMLEEREHALARGARVHGEIVGYGAAAETGPASSGIGRALRLALEEAGWAPSEVDCLVPGGVASAAQRRREKLALVELGCRPRRCFDPTARTGHALAAQATIALSLALTLGLATDAPPPRERAPRLLCSALGLLDQAVGLAVTAAGAP